MSHGETVLRPIAVRAKLPGDMERVFAYVSDPRNDPQWVDTTPEVEQTAGDGPQVGATYRFVQTVLRRVEGTIEILEMDPPHSMAFRVQDPFRDYRVTYSLRGGKHVTLTQTSHPRFNRNLGWRKFFVPFMTRKQLRKQMRGLRAALNRSEI